MRAPDTKVQLQTPVWVGPFSFYVIYKDSDEKAVQNSYTGSSPGLIRIPHALVSDTRR
jgi:hypothetical protein